MLIKTKFSLYLLMFALLSGCGLSHQQLTKTRTFSNATEHLGNIGEHEFINIRNEIIDLNKTLLVIDSNKKANNFELDQPTNISDTEKRVAASKALKNYGELLNQLANENRKENLQSAATKLLDNSTAALQTALPEETKNALNQLIVSLGSMLVEKRKADAARDIINTYQAPLNKIADLMHEDFSLAPESQGYLKAYENSAKQLKNAALKLLNENSTCNLSERASAVEAFAKAENAIIRAKALSQKAQQSILALKDANAELVKIMNHPEYNSEDIKQYARQIEELVNLYQILAR